MPSVVSTVIAFAYAAAAAHAYIVYPNGEIKNDFANPSCDFAVDVAQLIDVSWSQLDNAAQLKNDSEKVLDFIEKSNGRHRLALASFIDKPIAPLGWDTTPSGWTDWCFKLNIPFGQSEEQYKTLINDIYLAGGYDFPEAQLEALLRGALTSKLQWRSTSEDGLPVQKVLLIATDSIAHVAGDAAAAVTKLTEGGNNKYEVPTANNLSAEELDEGGLNVGCQSLEYPSFDFVGQTLKAQGILPVFLVSPAVYECTSNPTGHCVWPEMIKLATSTGNQDYKDPQKGIQTYYKDLITKLQTVGVVIPMGIGFEGYGDALKQAVYEIGTIHCEQSTTTTTTTSTSVASTKDTAPTTVGSVATEASTTTPATIPTITEGTSSASTTVTTHADTFPTTAASTSMATETTPTASIYDSTSTTLTTHSSAATTDAATTIPETAGSSEGCGGECQTHLIKIGLINGCNGNVVTDSFIV